MASLLFEVRVKDSVTYAAVSFRLLAAAVLAIAVLALQGHLGGASRRSARGVRVRNLWVQVFTKRY